VPVCSGRLWCLFFRNPWYLLVRAPMSHIFLGSRGACSFWASMAHFFWYPSVWGFGVYQVYSCRFSVFVVPAFCGAMVLSLFGALSVWRLSNLALVDWSTGLLEIPKNSVLYRGTVGHNTKEWNIPTLSCTSV
jgi:hypothetical protein